MAILSLTSQTQTSVYLSIWPSPILFPCLPKPLSAGGTSWSKWQPTLCCYLMRAMHVQQQKMLRQVLQYLKKRQWHLPTKQSDHSAYHRTVKCPSFSLILSPTTLTWLKFTSVKISHLRLDRKNQESSTHQESPEQLEACLFLICQSSTSSPCLLFYIFHWKKIKSHLHCF